MTLVYLLFWIKAIFLDIKGWRLARDFNATEIGQRKP